MVDQFTQTSRSMHFYDSIIVFEKGPVEQPHAEKTGTPTIFGGSDPTPNGVEGFFREVATRARWFGLPPPDEPLKDRETVVEIMSPARPNGARPSTGSKGLATTRGAHRERRSRWAATSYTRIATTRPDTPGPTTSEDDNDVGTDSAEELIPIIPGSRPLTPPLATPRAAGSWPGRRHWPHASAYADPPR